MLLILLWLLAQGSVLDTLIELRAAYPAEWSHADRGHYLNAVAWAHRSEGWGLLAKPGGNRCPTPQGIDVSCDYLVFQPTMQGYDVLVNETDPVFQIGDSFIGQEARFVAPVDPRPPVPEPEPPPPVVVEPPAPEPPTQQPPPVVVEPEPPTPSFFVRLFSALAAFLFCWSGGCR